MPDIFPTNDETVPLKVFTVFELTSGIKQLLETNFAFVWVNGEITNFSRPASGHYYFSLKDDRAHINAVMFRGQNRRLSFLPENGMQITALGRVSVYEPRGTYQLIIEHLEPKGIGALQIAFEQLKEKLKQEGLFDDTHKRPIPPFVHKIMVITSPTGAVVQDIINVATRRFPNIQITVLPVSVQGANARREIADAIETLNQLKNVDCAILARGGGSLEDLQAFNSETVARAVFRSEIPIVSAIGHETDFTITDFVADLRAPTPSAAAELIVPDKNDLLNRIQSTARYMTTLFQGILDDNRHKLERISGRLIHPRLKVQDYRMRMDDLLNRMVRYFSYRNQSYHDRLELIRKRLYANPLSAGIYHGRSSLERISDNLMINLNIIKDRKQASLQKTAGKLHTLNPAAILKRGYSITRTTSRRVVKDAATVSIGQNLEVILARGSMHCIVEGTEPDVQEDV